MRGALLILALLSLSYVASATEASDIEVEALISAYSRTATLEVDGKQVVMGISRRIGADYQEPKEQIVTITRDERLQYNTQVRINGRSMPALVDTGANLVALSSVHAKTLGIDYQTGLQSRVETASGMVNAWLITLRSVSVGGIRVDNVNNASNAGIE